MITSRRVWTQRCTGTTSSASMFLTTWSTCRSVRLLITRCLFGFFSVVDPHCFQCWPGSKFLVNAGPDSDPDPGPLLMTKDWNNWNKVTKWIFICLQKLQFNIPTEVFVPLKVTFSSSNLKFLLFLKSFVPSWFRIRIANADSDPAEENKCASGSTTPLFLTWWYISQTCIELQWNENDNADLKASSRFWELLSKIV